MPENSIQVTSHSVLIPAFKLVMATLSRIVIPSAAEGSFLHCDQYRIGTVWKRRLGATYFSTFTQPLFIGLQRRFLACARNDDTGVRGLLVTSHKSLAIRPCFQIFGAAISRIVIPSAAEGSFLHCGQYHISTGRETMSCCHVFLHSHRRRLSVCKEDFSLTLEMTMRESSSH